MSYEDHTFVVLVGDRHFCVKICHFFFRKNMLACFLESNYLFFGVHYPYEDAHHIVWKAKCMTFHKQCARCANLVVRFACSYEAQTRSQEFVETNNLTSSSITLPALCVPATLFIFTPSSLANFLALGDAGTIVK